MSHYKPYPAYQDSGVEWIGEVPAHWEVKPICRVASCNDDALPEGTPLNEMLRYVDISAVNHTDGITQVTEVFFADAPSRARRKAKSGDVVVSTVRTYLKAVAAVTDTYANCIYSTGFAVLRALRPHMEPTFLKWMMLNELLIQAIEAHSEGLSYPAINATELVKLKTIVPPLAEQTAIAAALSHEISRIDALITKKTTFIELLKEKRSALVTHAVTKGLDPNAKMKDSGVEWIGEVPDGWEVKPICRVASCNDDALSENTSADAVLRYVDISAVNHTDGITHVTEVRFADAPSRARRQAKSGDVVVSTVRTYLKAVAAVTEDYAGCIYSTGFAVLRARSAQVDPAFLKWMALNDLLIQAIEAHSEGLSYPAINATELVKLKAVVPPLTEQSTIAAFLDRETARIDALTAKAQRSIDLLKERRSAFITAAVTGRIDVRDHAVTVGAA
jgi:type I restriction enzyme S subunit